MLDFKTYKAPVNVKAVKHDEWTDCLYIKTVPTNVLQEAAIKLGGMGAEFGDGDFGDFFSHFVCDEAGELIATEQEAKDFFNGLPIHHVTWLASEIKKFNKPYDEAAIDAKKKR